MIDLSSPHGVRAAGHLRSDSVVWMTTVTASGAPLPRPVWFLWDGKTTVTVYSLPGARVRNLEANPKVTLHFNSDPNGNDVVVFSGSAAVLPSAPAADQQPTYLEKYAGGIERIGMTPASFAARYSVAVAITLARLDGH